MSQWRKTLQTGRVDANQEGIVRALRKILGVTVEVGMNDIIVGHKGKNYWYELKEPRHVSTVTGQIRPSEIKESQKKLMKNWKGHYKIVWSIDQILAEIGI